MPDVEQAFLLPVQQPAARHGDLVTSSSDKCEKDVPMQPIADDEFDDDNDDHASMVSGVSESSSNQSAQAGVKRLEAIATTWTKLGLFVAYFGVGLITYATSLESTTTANLTIYATSAFKAHSLVSTVLVVQGVVLSVVKPPMSKVADVFGRFEAFSLSVFIYTIGYIQQAASNNVKTYAAAQIFYSAGSTGLQILIQIFIADTSDLLNRAMCATIPDVPFLINTWIGAPLADIILERTSWRFGYGIWAVVLPIAYLPLALALWVNQRKAAARGLLPPSPFAGQSPKAVLTHLWYELDVFGLVLLCGAFSLILIPLTLVGQGGWKDPSLASMLVVGAVCLVAFPFWERSKKLAPRAFFPRHLFRQRTVLVGLAIAFFYFMAFYMSIYPYFQSYLLVVQNQSRTSAGRILMIFNFSATITSLLVSVLIKRTKHYKYFVTLGACIYLIGLIAMHRYRAEGTSVGVIIATQIVVGAGGGMLNVPAQLGVQASASHGEVAAATAIFLTFLEVGGAAGSAISGAIWTSNVPRKLAEYLPPETRDQASEIYGNVALAASGWPMGSPTRIAINRAYQETMTKILTAAVLVAIPVVLLTFFMENYKLDEMDQHVKGTVIGNSQSVADRRGETEPLAGSSRISYGSSDEDEPLSPQRRRRESRNSTTSVGSFVNKFRRSG